MKMERNIEIVRGWPFDGSLDRNETIASGQTLVNGDWVTKNSDNTVSKSSSTNTASAGVVIVGNGDSGSAAYSGKAVVLWGNFVATTKNLTGGQTYAPGGALTIKSGKIFPATGTDPVIGFVLDVIASSATSDASVTFVVR